MSEGMNQALFQAALKDTGCFPRFVSECELTNFERCLEINLDDPRDPSKIVYPLHVIGVIILTARVSGCNNCEEIRTYWEDHLDFFKKRLYDCPDEDYIPSAQTIRRVQTILDIDNLTQFYYEFFSKPAVAEEEKKTSTDIQDKEVHAIDGQNLRGTNTQIVVDRKLKNKPVYDIVSLYATRAGICLSQVTVDTKNQESKAIIELLKAVSVVNTIITWDALNTHVSTLEAVINAQADFVVVVKANQGYLFEEITDAFDIGLQAFEAQGVVSSATSIGKGHGRIEQRTIEILPAEYALSKEQNRKWKYIKSVIRVTNERAEIRDGEVTEPTTESHYYISSIEVDFTDNLFAQKMLRVILDRWKIEGVQHFSLDVLFEQDYLPLRNQQYIRNHSFFTKMAYNVVSYVRNNLPLIRGEKVALSALVRTAKNNPSISFEYIKAYFNKDVSALLTNEKMIRLGLVKAPKVEEFEEIIPQEDLGNDTKLALFFNSRKNKARKTKS